MVPTGYKQTDVGVIPTDWLVVSIGELAIFTSGKGISISALRMQSSDFQVPVYGGNGIAGYTTIPLIEEVSVVVGRVGQKCGEIYLTDGPAWISDNALYPRNFLRPLDIRFLALALKNSRLNDVRNRNDLPLITQSILNAVRVPWPPEPAEQRAIAAALSDVDELIAALDKLIAKKRAIKTAAMQQLLTGKRRLPGFSGKWSLKCLGEVVSLRKTRIDPRQSAAQEFCIELEHIESGSGRLIGSGSTGEQSSLRSAFVPGDVLFGKLRSYLRKYWLADRAGVCSTEIWVLVADRQWITPKFLFQTVTLDSFIEVASTAYGTHMPRSDWNLVRAYELELPAVEEQTAIATVLSDMDAEIAALEARRDKTQAIKQGMMQELLTGRIRLRQARRGEAVATQNADLPGKPAHNWAINEAVVIAALASKFGNEQYPLGRMRYTKLSYLMHRHVEKRAEGYLKKAAGPYNPSTRYKGPEAIAQKNGYVRAATHGKYSGFVAAENVCKALEYFDSWYGSATLQWLEPFRYEKKEKLELLATVDMAVEDLRAGGEAVTVEAVKEVIRRHPEWVPKLDREVFSDANIKAAIGRCVALFGDG